MATKPVPSSETVVPGEPRPNVLPDEKPTPVASHQYVYQATAPFVRSPYNYDVDLASRASGLLCRDPSLAVQSARDEVDINFIVRQFGLTGQLPEDIRAPQYGDFTAVHDYHSAMNAVALANESFDAMSPEVRARFHNDPAAFVDFCSNEQNREEMRKLGLLVPEVVVEVPSESVASVKAAASPA